MKWDSKKSVILSLACNRAVMVLAVAAAAALLWPPGRSAFVASLMETGSRGRLPPLDMPAVAVAVPAIALACVAAALFALWLLDRLLRNIRGGEVFVRGNVAALRGISWCCFAEAALLALAAFLSSVFFLFCLLALMAGFVGIILRVVKNVIEAAVLLKEENDLTI
ncbi:MAG: DUF2975 domain-containing protein [Clostridiales Family XIII bacterium]|jgi:hypothetical protein|nr:DUF2975 domain-containing protein [Clostridiales Family XIII bacterium]